jgi:uncharacterized secreted protein with C-terminal beta-propeller domain
MKILQCDLCGKIVEKDNDLYTLRKEFQYGNAVKEVCHKCNKELSSFHDNERHRLLKKMEEDLKGTVKEKCEEIMRRHSK